MFQSYYLKNREKKLEYAKKYKSENREKRNMYLKSLKTRESIKNRVNNKYKTNINFKLSCVLRARLLDALKNNYKGGSAVENLGCSIPEFKKYLESKFKKGMSWDNFGYYGWHIDHIKPLISFNLSNPEDIKKVCHYSNLQPLWAKENISKGGK